MDYVASPKEAYPLTAHQQLSWLRRLAVLTTVWALVVIILGAYTRLVDAGLGCPDWPGCYGFLTVPNEAHEIAEAEARFPHAPVEVAKGWPEMIHRYLASTLGLLIFSLAVLSWRTRSKLSALAQTSDSLQINNGRLTLPRKHTWLLCALVVLQGLFGMWTVTLKLWPQVVSAHLLGGFTTLSLLALLCMRLFASPIQVSAADKARLQSVKPLLLTALVFLVLQISLGAWVTSNYSALACTGFPACNGDPWPAMDFQDGFNLTQSIGPNYLGGILHQDARVAVHMSHRFGALAVTLLICLTLVQVRRKSHGLSTPNRAVLMRSLALVASLLLLQVGLGITNVVALLPLPVAVAHNAVAALLLVSLLWLGYRIWTLQAPVHRQSTVK